LTTRLIGVIMSWLKLKPICYTPYENN